MCFRHNRVLEKRALAEQHDEQKHADEHYVQSSEAEHLEHGCAWCCGET
jgi:hypothetical protein